MKLHIARIAEYALIPLLFFQCKYGSHEMVTIEITSHQNPVDVYLPLNIGTEWRYDYYVRTENLGDVYHTGDMSWTVSGKEFFDEFIIYSIRVRKNDLKITGVVDSPSPSDRDTKRSTLDSPYPGDRDTTRSTEEYDFQVLVEPNRIILNGDRFCLELVTPLFCDSANFTGTPDTIRYTHRSDVEWADDIVFVKNVGIVQRVYHYHQNADDIYLKFAMTAYRGL